MIPGNELLPRRPPIKCGFTLIELLVVITIISLLLALLIPAVMAARRAAIKSQCANNLRQIGIAIHQHAQSHGTFPAGVGKRAKESYLVQILPYLEQGTLYGLINVRGQSLGEQQRKCHGDVTNS